MAITESAMIIIAVAAGIILLVFAVLLANEQQSTQPRRGRPGSPGPDGHRGHRGRNGLNGFPGVFGVQGLQGTAGRGFQGYQGLMANCCGGLQGAVGAQGLGTQGLQGVGIGLQGVEGMQGNQGYIGATGATGSVSIIPFASGSVPMTLDSAPPTILGSLIAFSRNASTIPVTDPLPLPLVTLGFAFSMPRTGVLTSLAAYFSVFSNLNAAVGQTIRAQLYSSSSPNNFFTSVPGGFVDLSPALVGMTLDGTIANGITTGINFPVTTETRLVLLFYLVSDSVTSLTVLGIGGAGLGIV